MIGDGAGRDGDDVVGGASGVRPERRSLGIALFTAFARTLICLLGIDGGDR